MNLRPPLKSAQNSGSGRLCYYSIPDKNFFDPRQAKKWPIWGLFLPIFIGSINSPIFLWTHIQDVCNAWKFYSTGCRRLWDTHNWISQNSAVQHPDLSKNLRIFLGQFLSFSRLAPFLMQNFTLNSMVIFIFTVGFLWRQLTSHFNFLVRKFRTS